jgi:hypothetical protein
MLVAKRYNAFNNLVYNGLFVASAGDNAHGINVFLVVDTLGKDGVVDQLNTRKLLPSRLARPTFWGIFAAHWARCFFSIPRNPGRRFWPARP